MKKFLFWFVVAVFVTNGSLSLSAQKKSAGAAASPSSSSTSTAASPSSGSSAALEAQMLAFGGLDEVAEAIASQTCQRIYPKGAGPDATVVIFDQATFANIQAYQGFIANAAALKSLYYSLLTTDEYDDVKSCQSDSVKQRIALFPNSPEALAAKQRQTRAQAEAEAKRKAACDLLEKQNPGVPCPQPRALGTSSTIDPFSDATTLLSALAVSSNSESPGSITIPDSAMAVAVTGQMINQCSASPHKLAVIYPPLFGRASVSDIATSDMQSVLQDLHDIRSCVIQEVDQRTDTWAQKQLAIAAKPDSGQPTQKPVTPTVTLASDPIATPALVDANGMYDNFMNALLQVNSSSGAVGSGAIEQGYQLAAVLAGPIDQDKEVPTYSHPAYTLLASILSAAGTMRDHKTLWTALTTGDKITFSGGLIVNVALWKTNDPMPMYATILRYRVPFTDVQDPKHPSDGKPKPFSGSAKGDNLP